ncbi:4Fe-4S ferredoxin [Alsobacter soli]|uniref:4Fe-4S ferredoxin n=1 Tax=Alsobacter soli TaxID=2109933 RepID=A0A2T1HXQ9_9HYPH|nr:4Fe-4S dicluster domain-containing protein [Alsobacter soli]PSC06476.1 4Fe-4S ferredoxin [Alsobacter soli]
MPPLNDASAGGGLTRRAALQALAASMALAATSCSGPDEEIVPAVLGREAPPGEPERFATALALAGYGRGVVGVTVNGRPIAVEGAPRHPGSGGAADVFAEAAILSLYDPDRSRAILRDGAIASRESFLLALEQWRKEPDAGGGLRFLTGRVTSPTLLRQIAAVLAAFPGARWHAYEAADVSPRASLRLAYGREIEAVPHLEKVDALVCLDADPLGPGPDQVRLARGWAEGRRRGAARLYAVESRLTLTGAKADGRLALAPAAVEACAAALANRFGAGMPEPDLPPAARPFVEAAAAALRQAPGRALVLPGPALAPEAGAWAWWINEKLRAPLDLLPAFDRAAGAEPEDPQALRDDLAAGRVRALLILDANPAYDWPTLGLAEHLPRTAFSLHLGPAVDETAALCRWHVPQAHPLETWTDLRAPEGLASVAQPLIAPLFGGWSSHELLEALMGKPDSSARDEVRASWTMADADWRVALAQGFVADSAPAPLAGLSARAPAPAAAPAPPAPGGLDLVIEPDPTLWDGRFANNAWLQECPKPLGKQVWGNSLALAAEDAARLSVVEGDLVTARASGKVITVPVRVVSGQPTGAATLALGHGRQRAGAIGNGVGANAFPLREGPDQWVIRGVEVAKAKGRGEVLTTQNVVRLDGERRDLFRFITDAQAPDQQPTPVSEPSLYPAWPGGGPAWAMVIDTGACIGCNACVVACQSENNVPVVGPEEIGRGRVMHWLRVDEYEQEGAGVGFQPVPCMHCEQAPCEPVCPVAASVHDSEGLNAQVYNRCVGTRFCEANCPYKVRRFNFFGYADGQEYANLGAELLKARANPEVTVRARGVMEKCTYCVQRIAKARQDAERDSREDQDLAVVTACQQACPTRAIAFGDLNAKDSTVRDLRADPRHYVLLERLNTRPRTTYLADRRNPDPALGGGA